MEGFLLRKTDGYLFRKKWIKKYFIIDTVGHSIAIFPDKPALDDDDVVDGQTDDTGNAADDGNEPAQAVQVEEVVDFSHIDQVNYLRNKSEGRRFEITFYQRSPESDVENKGKLLTYSLAAPSQRSARKWVKSIITSVAVQKSRELNTKRESQKSVDGNRSRSRSRFQDLNMRRRTNSILDNMNIEANLDSLRPRRKSTALEVRKGSVELKSSPFAVIPVSNLNLDLKSDELWKAMLSPIMPSSTGSQPSSTRGSKHHSRRNIVFTHDREALLHLIDVSPTKPVTPQKSRLSLTRKRKQIIISPFKLSIWNLFMISISRFGETSAATYNIREKTIETIQKIGNPDSALNMLIRKEDVIFSDPTDEDSASDAEISAVKVPDALSKPFSDSKLTPDEFDIVLPSDFKQMDYKSSEINFENMFFWICEMMKPEASGGVSRLEKHCVLVIKDNDVVGLRQGKAWNTKFPAFSVFDAIQWLTRERICQTLLEARSFLQMALKKNFIAKLGFDENERPNDTLEDGFSYYFVSEMNIVPNLSALMSSPKDGKEEQPPELKDIPSESDFSVSFKERKRNISEADEDRFAAELFVEIIASNDFLSFFCSFPNDSTILTALLKQLNSDSRLPMNVVLTEWKGMMELADQSMSEQYSLKLKLFNQVMFDVLFEFNLLLKEKLTQVFEMEDSGAHGLALDLYWDLLKRELADRHMCNSPLTCSICTKVDKAFNSFVANYLSDYRFCTEPVMRSLLGALLDEVWYPVKPLPFNNPVVRPGVWKSYFLVLTNSEENMFNECLQDAFALLIDNQQNALDMACQEGWVSWILPYVPIVQGQDYANRLMINLISRVLFHTFFEKADFPDFFVKCLIDIESSTSTVGSEFSLLTAYNAIQALIGSIAAGAKLRFPRNPSLYETPHLNLKSLCYLTMHFIFSSHDFAISKPFSPSSYSHVPSSIPQDYQIYIQTRKEFGFHSNYRRFARRMLVALSETITALQLNVTSGGAPESQAKFAYEKEMSSLNAELRDAECLLAYFQAAEEQIQRSIDPAGTVKIKLSESFVIENVKKFYTLNGEKRTAFLRLVFPELLNNEVTKLVSRI